MTNIVVAYDERMTLHCPSSFEPSNLPKNADEPGFQYENPYRVKYIFDRLILLDKAYSTSSNVNRCHVISCKQADRETIELAHSSEHYDFIACSSLLTDDELDIMTEQSFSKKDDVYYCKDTFLASTLACGGVVECVNMVTGNEFKRAIAVVRPPGHHACTEKAQGFCFFNSVAVAAKHAIKTNRAKRVFIIDWDVHHGNGTQDLTYDDPDIFYLSIHRGAYNKKSYYYPGTGRHNEIGEGEAVGKNLNILLTKAGMGNSEYALAFNKLVLPVLSAFNPDLIIVSSGFDAAMGDIIGDCNVTPIMYYHMTRSLLQTIANVPIVVALEGGYNLDILPLCMESVALALLDELWVENALSESPKHVENVRTDGAESNFETNNAKALYCDNNSELSDSIKKENSNNMLENARKEMIDFLPNTEEESINPITKSAIQSINKSIRAIRKASFWKENILLQEIKIWSRKNMNTGTKSSMKEEEQLSELAVEDLDLSMSKINLT